MSVIRWTPEQLEAHQKRLGLTRKAIALIVPSAPTKFSKYKAIKTGKHASKREAKRAEVLRLLEKSGKITMLEEQVRFDLIPAQYIDGKCVERSGVYVADFVYLDLTTDPPTPVCEDVKGMKTPVYVLKRKLMLHVHGIRIRET